MTTTQTPTGSPPALYPAPTGVRVATVEAGRIVLIWEAMAGATSYRVFRGSTEAPGSATEIATGIAGPNHEDTGAAVGEFVFYWVKATYAGGTSGFSGMASGWRKPGTPAAPANLTASSDDPDQVALTWSAADAAEFFQVWRSLTNSSAAATFLGETASTSFDDTTAEIEQVYFYFVRGVNYTTAPGAFSASAAGSRDTPVPSPPANLTASDSTQILRVDLAWDASEYALSYKVYRDGTYIGTTTGTTYQDNTAAGGVSYSYTVTAVGVNGESDASTANTGTADHPPTPAAPSNVSATDGTLVQLVRITWDAAPWATAYEVWASTGTDSAYANKVSVSDITGTTHDWSVIVPGTYYFWIKAKNYRGTSGFSAYDAGSPQSTTPAAPASLSASDGTQGDVVRLTWARSIGANQYELWQSASSTIGSASLLATVSDYVSGDGNNSYDDETPTSTATRYYWVKAKNTVGTSSETPAGTGETGYAATPGAASPTNTTTTDGAKIALAWPEVTHARSYKVFRATSDSFGAASLLTSGNTSRTFDDTTATPEQAYYYFIVATNDVGDGSPSVSAYGYRPLVIPSAPTGVAASSGNYGHATVTWESSAGATSYEVWRSSSPYLTSPTMLGEVSTLSFTDDPPDTATYYYFVKAKSSAGTSAASSADSGSAISPDTPTSLTASDDKPNRIDLSWVNAGGGETFNLYRGPDTNPANASLIVENTSELDFSDAPPALGVVYYYFAKAKAGALLSDFTTWSDGVGFPDLCDAVSLTGGDEGHDTTYAIEAGGYYTFAFNAFNTIPDRLIVYNNGFTVFDTSCTTGTVNSGSILLGAGTVRLYVIPHCTGGTGTEWAVDITGCA